MAGNSAMLLNANTDTLSSMIKEDPSMADKLGVASSLKGKTGGVHSGAWLYAITSQSKNPDLAWEFISFVFSDERCRARMDLVGMVPPIKSLSDEYIAKDPLINEPQLENMTWSMAFPAVAWSNAYSEALNLAYEEIVYGTDTPAGALAHAEEEIAKNR